jgi:deoxyadenosine/deoxycytidine kinase
MSTPEIPRYIAVEGVIGVGKTSLAAAIAERIGARLVREEFDENPFLPAFYADPPRWAFHTQLAFLASRFRQQRTLRERDLFQQAVVSDYTFDKDRLFARLNLSGDELQLYETLFSIMEPNAPVPDLVVYLRSSVERLLENIRRRGRDYEVGMDPAYLADLSAAYDRYFLHYRKGPLIVIPATGIDFVGDAAQRESLIRRVLRAGSPAG